MGNKLAKIVVSDLIKGLLTALITFWATKNAIGHDVALKLAHGDTVSLWQGSIPLSISLITSTLAGLAVPIVLPIGQGIYARISEAYKLIVARASAFAMTKQELKNAVAETSTVDMIKAVATNTVPPDVVAETQQTPTNAAAPPPQV